MEYDIGKNTTKNTQHVLQINADNFGNGGISSIIFRYMENLRHYGIIYDYLSNKKTIIPEYEDRVAKNNGLIIHVDWGKLPFAREISKVIATKNTLQKGNYDTIHINGDDILFMFPFILGALLSKCKIQIVIHSHTTRGNSSNKTINELRVLFSRVLGIIIIPKVDVLLSCSTQSALYAYGKRHSKKAIVVKNGINFEKFIFNEEKRDYIRLKYNSQDKFVIGHIGHFSYAKNHDFIIDVFEAVSSILDNAELWLIGAGGPLECSIKDRVEKSTVRSKIRFIGQTNNVNDYYSAMDIFLFPSRYEGFPLALTEAQANGVPALYSDCITKECIFAPNAFPMSLDYSADSWSKKILSIYKNNSKRTPGIIDKSLDISTCSLKLLDIYKTSKANQR